MEVALTTNKGQKGDENKITNKHLQTEKYIHFKVTETGEKISVLYGEQNQSYSNLLRAMINRFNGVIPAGSITHTMPFTSK